MRGGDTLVRDDIEQGEGGQDEEEENCEYQ